MWLLQKRQKHSGIGRILRTPAPPVSLRFAQQRPDTHTHTHTPGTSQGLLHDSSLLGSHHRGRSSDEKPPLDKLQPAVFKEHFQAAAHQAPDGWWWLRSGSYASQLCTMGFTHTHTLQHACRCYSPKWSKWETWLLTKAVTFSAIQIESILYLIYP